MLHAFQPAPFPDADRQRQYEAVQAALAAGPQPALLLGNLAALASLPVDALLLLPDCLVLLVLVPGAGRLDLPALPLGAWQLGGQLLPARADAPNPLAHYQAQLPAVQAWVAAQLGRPVAELPPSRGLVVFNAPLTFGPAVERRLAQATGPAEFALLGGAARLPAYLAAEAGPAWLAEAELADWAADLRAPEPAPSPARANDSPATYLLHQLRRLRQWLGAADVPPDPPYGGAPYPTPPDHREEARLHQLRQELQHEQRQQRQEAAAREAAYQQELLRLQQLLLQAGSAAGAQQTQAAEAARLAAQAELDARAQELDRRIQQLGELIGQVQARPAATRLPAPRAVPATAQAPRRPRQLPPVAAPRWPRRRPTAGALLGVLLAGAGLGLWALERQRAPAQPRLAAPHHRATLAPALPSEGEAATPSPVYVADSSLAAPATRFDTAATEQPGRIQEPAELGLQPQPAPLRTDSQYVAAPLAPADSVHPAP